MTLHVEVLMPDRALWSGEADMVIAKTLDGDIGVQAGHSPVFGILSPGSLVRIPAAAVEGSEEASGEEIKIAVRDGFLSVTGDRVSVLASVGQRSGEVDVAAVRADLESAESDAGSASAADESPEVRYARAQLRAAGEQA
ncbi:MAG: F0F1 ATP synthase subunit epsilon [Streptosporangiales bacterium]|nr:F0F1 ATP synthase subunit epsilon [Streptosporangiales bacterium]